MTKETTMSIYTNLKREVGSVDDKAEFPMLLFGSPLAALNRSFIIMFEIPATL
jgi:hypothetical protein